MRFFLQIISILVIILTISICAIKPDMHKTLLIYNSDYKLIPETIEIMAKEDIKIAEAPIAPEAETIKKEVNTVSENKTVKKSNTNTVQDKTAVKQPKQPAFQTTEPVSVNTVKQETVKQAFAKVEKKNTTQPVKQKAVAENATKIIPLASQQEEIAWNVWRSNLQNKIMQDAKLPILPYGIVFKFSFTVDKYGKVSNVYVYSTNQTYTPYAVQYIAPVIRSYQGKSVLDFPEGSTRTVTEVKGGWKISGNERYSTPQDYNDVEKIIR